MISQVDSDLKSPTASMHSAKIKEKPNKKLIIKIHYVNFKVLIVSNLFNNVSDRLRFKITYCFNAFSKRPVTA